MIFQDGDWRPAGWGLFLGAPLGALLGFAIGTLATRNLGAKAQDKMPVQWFAGAGLLAGVALGAAFLPNPFLELCQSLGKLVSLPILGTLLYFFLCGMVGAAMAILAALLMRGLRGGN